MHGSALIFMKKGSGWSLIKNARVFFVYSGFIGLSKTVKLLSESGGIVVIDGSIDHKPLTKLSRKLAETSASN